MTRNWDDLKFLLAVAEAGTLSGAATALETNPTTVSRRVRRLESELGFPLIERAGEGWRPTPSGGPLVETARRIHRAMETAETEISRETSSLKGKITIDAKPFVTGRVLAPRSRDFIDRYPDVELHLGFNTRAPSLAQGETDIALRITQPSEGRLVRRKLASFGIAMYQRSDLPETGGRWLGLTDSAESHAIMAVGHRTMPRKPSVRFQSLRNLALAMVESGLPGPLPSCVAQEYPQLRPMPGPDTGEASALWAIYHESKRTDPRITAAMAWLSELFPNPARCVCGACR